MLIIQGRGNNRKVLAEIPTGQLAAAYAKSNPVDYETILQNVCRLLGLRQ